MDNKPNWWLPQFPQQGEHHLEMRPAAFQPPTENPNNPMDFSRFNPFTMQPAHLFPPVNAPTLPGSSWPRSMQPPLHQPHDSFQVQPTVHQPNLHNSDVFNSLVPFHGGFDGGVLIQTQPRTEGNSTVVSPLEEIDALFSNSMPDLLAGTPHPSLGDSNGFGYHYSQPEPQLPCGSQLLSGPTVEDKQSFEMFHVAVNFPIEQLTASLKNLVSQAQPEQAPQPSPESSIVHVDGLCDVCQAIPFNGTHFGAKTCKACSAFFRRTISELKQYFCRRDKHCKIIGNLGPDGYRKTCRSCRLKRCFAVGMQAHMVQGKRPPRYLVYNRVPRELHTGNVDSRSLETRVQTLEHHDATQQSVISSPKRLTDRPFDPAQIFDHPVLTTSLSDLLHPGPSNISR